MFTFTVSVLLLLEIELFGLKKQSMSVCSSFLYHLDKSKNLFLEFSIQGFFH